MRGSLIRRVFRPLALSATLAVALAPLRGADAQLARSTPPAKGPDSALAVVRGTLFDSVTRAPLPGATVQFVGATDSVATGPAYSAPTDSLGRFEIAKVRPGRYVVGYFHAILDSLRIEPPLRMVDVAPPVTRVFLATPSGEKLLSVYCGPRPPADSTGVAVGWVYDAATRRPVRGATVLLTWRELVIGEKGLRLEHRRRMITPDSTGFYTACGLPTDAELLGTADAGPRHTGLVGLSVPPRGLLHRSFALGDSGTVTPAGDSVRVVRGSAQLSGTVRNFDGRAISGARVSLWGAGINGTTGADGRFTLPSLPAGTFSAEVRALGYAPKRVAIDLASGRTTPLAVTLEEAAVALAPVTVVGKPDASRDFSGFLERRQRGLGRYITREDIERRNPIQTTDALRTTPGLQIAPNGSTGSVILGRNGCQPAVILDGMAIQDGNQNLDELVQPSDVRGIEVYTNPGTAPPQFSLYDTGCGIVVVWTGR